MDQDSLVEKGVGEKRVDGAGRICKHRLGKLRANGSKSKIPRPVALALQSLLLAYLVDMEEI